MVCIYCGSDTEVVNSRSQKRSNSVWRRRKCKACDRMFSTEEHIDYEKTLVVKYKQRKPLPFLRDKLFTSIYRSCMHRPSALQDTIGLTDTIIAKLWQLAQNGQLDSTAIAQTAHLTLKRFDKAAAVSYQAFHADLL
jgi:transcriptional repressor NrdR